MIMMEALSSTGMVLVALVLGLITTTLMLFVFPGAGRTRPRAADDEVKYPPEVPGRWPLIGHLHRLMDEKVPLSKTLGEFADKHGPLVTFWIGVHRTVVASTWDMAKECLATNDRALASRPAIAAGKYLSFNYAIFGFSPYGQYWRETRKISTHELLSARQLDLLKHVRSTEVELGFKDLYARCGTRRDFQTIQIDLKDWFGDLAFNNVVMTVVGKRYFGANVRAEEAAEAKKFQRAIFDFFPQSGNPIPSDAVPFLEWFDIGGRIRAMKKTAGEMDSFASAWLEERRRLRRLAGDNYGPDRDFLDVMLTQVTGKAQLFDGYHPDTVIKATVLTMILAGTETTSIALTWVVSLLLNNRHVLKKAQEELDAQIGNEREATESDIKNLPYLGAIVKETMRLYPAVHVTAPHEAMEDCVVGGYKIPAGTRVFVNMWKLQRDPSIWPDPLEFIPERFLGEKADLDIARGHNFELLPFSAGRRMCPGGPFALHVLHLVLARLLHEFDLKTPNDEPVDMTDAPGLTISKATPLPALLTPRLPKKP
ncbi:hypothetical protein H6P81_011501 [Aristolochia fimbriata]|uniref:Cytochrome P450 n=1 Tax=Aristolochia fimbriata TaxID=158543 RepID=A0AAV7EST2_ARIFI|nr:hypothetical protein H6P81_011501 [Aristolochia fimbriata]